MQIGPDSAWIKELLGSSHLPSDTASEQVRGFLIIPLKELEDLDAQILQLKNQLSGLETRRDETLKRITQYRLILAPIRRVPPDVLREIFLHCLPTDRNPIIKPTEAPLLLTHICNSWRAVAVSSRRLWERIYITFTDDDTVPDLESAAEMVRNGRITSSVWQNALPKSEKERTTALLHRRYEAVKEWVSRSGPSRPLSISLSFSSAYWYDLPISKRSPSITMDLLSFLATLAPRLRDLELKTSPEIHEILERMMKPALQMTALTSVTIEYPVSFPAHGERNRPSSFFHAPHLQSLSIRTGGDFRIWTPDSSTRWTQLTSIFCFDTLTIAQTIVLLRRAPNLVPGLLVQVLQ